jgi:peptidoglycan-N-acetylglucosamine deacetylase
MFRTALILIFVVMMPGFALAQRSVVHLTFDDGPNPNTTPRLLDLLKAHQAKATFYVTGENVRRSPAIIKRIVLEGHSLGNHTWNHPNLSTLSAEQIAKQLSDTQQAVDQALLKPEAIAQGKHFPMRTSRPPFGAVNNNVRGVIGSILTPAGKVLAAKGKLPEGAGHTKVVLWQVDSNDWRKQGLQAVLNNVFPALAQGSKPKIVLFHDIHATTVDQYMPTVMQKLKDDGYPIERLDKVRGYIGTRTQAPAAVAVADQVTP